MFVLKNEIDFVNLFKRLMRLILKESLFKKYWCNINILDFIFVFLRFFLDKIKFKFLMFFF